jgi:drug/metabolite transporter (DMT)-like permease
MTTGFMIRASYHRCRRGCYERGVIVGVLLALLTSVSWALGNVFIQKSGKAVGAPRAMLWALSVGAALAGVASLAHDTRPAPFSGAMVGWAAAAVLGCLFAYICLFYAFERAPLSLAVSLVSAWSLISSAISLTLLGERPRPLALVGAAVVFTGVVLVSLGGSRGAEAEAARPGSTTTRGALLAALGAAVGFGVMVPAVNQIVPAAGEFGATALVYAAGVVIALPIALLARVPLRPPPLPTWGLVLLTGCFETFGFVLLAFAHRYAGNTVVTPVSSLAGALTVLYAWVVLRERPHPLATAGAVLASVGIVILSN